MVPEDFDSVHKAAVQARHSKINYGGREIAKLLKDT